jgi:hypothetical protein
MHDHLEVARLLLQHGASKTAVCTSGKTSYRYAGRASAALRALVMP